MHILTTVLFTVFESIWRRTHGGGPISNWWNDHVRKWLFGLSARVFFSILNLVVVGCLGWYVFGLVWWKVAVLVVSVWIFWDASFGMYMDMGRCYPPSESEKHDYKDTLFNWVLDWMFPASLKYGRLYDFCQMWFRYTWPVVALPIFGICSWWFLAIGLLVAFAYELGWVLWERNIVPFGIGSTELAEYLAGGLLGLLLCLAAK